MASRPVKSSWTARLPLLADLRAGDRAQFTQDGLAGTITAILLIPQALAYALLAGLPPEIGLYASVLPVLVYALLGSSRTLAVGPVAVAAVMVTAALTPYANGDPAKYLSGALILSALSGVILLAMAGLRLGWLTHFISHPVLAGFTTGAALFIIGTQLSALSGIPVPRDAHLDGIVSALVAGLGRINLATLAFGVLTVSLLLAARGPFVRLLIQAGIKREHAVIAGRTAPLVLVIAATLISAVFDAHGQWGVAVVGTIPQGIPGLSLSFLGDDGWTVLMTPALMIAVIGYVESISVAKALAFRRNEKIDADQELMALGATNLVAACAGGRRLRPLDGQLRRRCPDPAGSGDHGAVGRPGRVPVHRPVGQPAEIGAGGDHRGRGLAAGRFQESRPHLAL